MIFLERLKERAIQRRIKRLEARNFKYREWFIKIIKIWTRNKLEILSLQIKLGILPLDLPSKAIEGVAGGNNDEFMEEIERGKNMPEHKEKKGKK